MAISYPLTPPASPNPARVSFTMTDVVAMSESAFTLEQQVQEHSGKRWGMEIELPTMDRPLADPWRAFLMALNGRAGTFLMGDPSATAPRGVGTGTPLVNGAGQAGQVLITDGWTIGTTGILLAGDYVQIGSYLYVSLKDVNSDGAGNATLDLWPRLRSSPANNAALAVNNTVGLWRLASNTRGWTISPGNLYRGLTFQAVEAI